MVTLPLSWALVVIVLAVVLGLREGRRLPVDCVGMDVGRVGRQAPYLYALLPLCGLALVGDALLIRAPVLQWRAPLWLLVWYAPLSRGVEVGTLAFIGTLVACLAVRGRHPRAPWLAGVAVLSVIAFLAFQGCAFRPLERSSLCDNEQGGVILQSSGDTCVAAASANILRSLGVPVREVDMVELLGTTADGTSLAQAVLGLQHLGFYCRLVEAGDIQEVRAPALLYVMAETHVVAFMGRREGHLEVLDPARGRLLLTAQELARTWSGHAIEIHKGAVGGH